MPMTFEEARKWAENHLEADEYEEIFGEVTEDDSRRTVTFSLPVGVVEKLKREASKEGITQSEMLSRLIEEEL